MDDSDFHDFAIAKYTLLQRAIGKGFGINISYYSFLMPPTRKVATATGSPTTTPTRPNGLVNRGPMAITVAQKQALIDNLQLEGEKFVLQSLG